MPISLCGPEAPPPFLRKELPLSVAPVKELRDSNIDTDPKFGSL